MTSRSPEPELDVDRVVEAFLQATQRLSPREAEKETGVSRTTLRALRGGARSAEAVRERTVRTMIDYLRGRGLLPPESSAGTAGGNRTLTSYRGSRAEIAIQHFGSPAVARALGWRRDEIASALLAYAVEQEFGDDDMQKIRAEIAHQRDGEA